MSLPKDPGTVVGLEERGRPRPDGSGSYKGKAEGSNSSEGLWIANLKGDLDSVGGVAWFESAYDAMAFYQLNREQIKSNPPIQEERVCIYRRYPYRGSDQGYACRHTGGTPLPLFRQ